MLKPVRLQVKDFGRNVEWAVTVTPPVVPDEALDRLREVATQTVDKARAMGLTKHPDDAAIGLAVLLGEKAVAERLGHAAPRLKPRRRAVGPDQPMLWEDTDG